MNKLKADLKDVIADLDLQSGQLSTNTRTFALSLLAVSWGLLIGADKASFTMTSDFRMGLVRVGVLVIGVLVVDTLQYVSGFLNSWIKLKEAEKWRKTKLTYNTRAALYILREVFFGVKVLSVLAIGIYFLALIAPVILSANAAH